MIVYRLENRYGGGPYTGYPTMGQYIAGHNSPLKVLPENMAERTMKKLLKSGSFFFGWNTERLMYDFILRPEGWNALSDEKFNIVKLDVLENHCILLTDGQVMFSKRSAKELDRFTMYDFRDKCRNLFI